MPCLSFAGKRGVGSDIPRELRLTPSLSASSGDYQNTCINCHLEGELQTTLVCDCKVNSAGGEVEYKTTSIDTSEYLCLGVL